MQSNAKVVVALALCVLVLPAVVNAIMVKAAGQAEMEWLRNADSNDLDSSEFDLDDYDGEIPDDLDGNQTVNPPPIMCTVVAGVVDERTVTPETTFAAGALVVTIAPGDVAVGIRIKGANVTGMPDLAVTEDGTSRWEYQPDSPILFRDANFTPAGAQGLGWKNPTAGKEWRLEYDLSRTTHDGVHLALSTFRCAEAAQ